MYISASLNKPLDGKIVLQFNNLKEGSNICRIFYPFSKKSYEYLYFFRKRHYFDFVQGTI